jgi:F420H(2)-dependent quinone reductase
MSIWVKVLMATNVLAYRLSGGRLGSKMAGQSVLLLHTVGRKSGEKYTTPINYYRDGSNYVLVASNWGQDHHPGWYHNLMSQQTTTIEVKGKELQVSPRRAVGEEYDRLWQDVTSKNDFYIRYQQQTTRRIPIVILMPE